MAKGQKYGRPTDPDKAGRKTFTTVLQKDLIKKLKIKALNEDVTVADLLEQIITPHLST